MAISKVNINGLNYEIGSGGPKGYSGSINNISGFQTLITYQLEDGTIETIVKSDFDTQKKYVWLAMGVINSNYGITNYDGKSEIYTIGEVATLAKIIVPTQEGWWVEATNFNEF